VERGRGKQVAERGEVCKRIERKKGAVDRRKGRGKRPPLDRGRRSIKQGKKQWIEEEEECLQGKGRRI
jgi:hypothetical protein